MRLRDFNLGQRLVAVVALGATLSLLASYIVERYINGPVSFGYVPLTQDISTGGPSFAAVLVWLVTIAVWGVASVWMLGLPYLPSETTDADPDGE